MDNPEAGEFIELFLQSAEQLIRITRAKDQKAFRELFESLKRVFDVGGVM